MSETDTPEQEPSIEEILGSIRRIISEEADEETLQEHDAAVEKAKAEVETATVDDSDNKEDAPVTNPENTPPQQDRQAPASEPEEQPVPDVDPETMIEDGIENDDDILELTETVDDEDEAEEAKDPDITSNDDTEPDTADFDDISDDSIEDEAVITPEEEETADKDQAETPSEDNSPQRNSDEALLSNEAAIAASAALAKLAKHTPVAATEGITLEHITRELLKPLLKTWLDENLPAIVEQKVEEELARLAKQK